MVKNSFPLNPYLMVMFSPFSIFVDDISSILYLDSYDLIEHFQPNRLHEFKQFIDEVHF
jgi:hypothetical protein